jgi:hypothetical protein
MTDPKKPEALSCKVAGCKKPHLARGFCRLHYARWRSGKLTATGAVRTVKAKHKSKPAKKTKVVAITTKVVPVTAQADFPDLQKALAYLMDGLATVVTARVTAQLRAALQDVKS